MNILIFIILPAQLVWGGAPDSSVIQKYDREIKLQEAELSDIRGKIQENRRSVEKLKVQEGNVLFTLEKLEMDLDFSRQLLTSLERKNKILHLQREDITDTLIEAYRLLSNQQKKMEKRLRIVYKQGRLRDMELLFSARSFIDFMRRYKFLHMLNENDKRVWQNIQRGKESISLKKLLLEENIGEINAVTVETALEESTLVGTRQERKHFLASLKKQRTHSEEVVAEFEKKEKSLQQILALMEHARKEALARLKRGEKRRGYFNFARHKSKLIWPVTGNVIREFGKYKHPQFGTITFSKGIDIGVAFGEIVAAVSRGEVVYVGWLRGYGKIILLDHYSGFYSLYGNLSEIIVTKGDLVLAGERIAKAGETGSLEGPKLHFEIRKGRESLDPLKWLKKKPKLRSMIN